MRPLSYLFNPLFPLSKAKHQQTRTCIPNPHTPQLFAPFKNPDICPSWNERWELRTRTLGCWVSPITFLTFVCSVVGTLVFVGLVCGCVKLVRWVLKVWRWREEGWWRCRRLRNWRLWKGKGDGERRALLESCGEGRDVEGAW